MYVMKTVMRRTQILLRDDQYRALQRRSRSERKSMGEVVRDLIDRGSKAPKSSPAGRRALARLSGFVPEADIAGRDHDMALYGKR
jgi:hypothetical protein